MKKYKNLKNTFSNIGCKMSMGRSPTEIVFFRSFFIESLPKKIFEVGDPKNRRLWVFFQKSMSEISVSGEKTCFLCC